MSQSVILVLQAVILKLNAVILVLQTVILKLKAVILVLQAGFCVQRKGFMCTKGGFSVQRKGFMYAEGAFPVQRYSFVCVQKDGSLFSGKVLHVFRGRVYMCSCSEDGVREYRRSVPVQREGSFTFILLK